MKTACVTGADRGLGLELSRRLLQDGCEVFAGQYLAEGEALTALAAEYPQRLHVLRLDISSDASVAAAAAKIRESADKLDLLLNNGAILGDIRKTIYDPLDFDEMLQVYNVNTLGPLRMTNALIDLVVRSADKRIANISSEAGSIGDCWRPNWFAYSMSKTALNMQTALLHNQLKDTGARVLAIHPGWVATYMQGKLDSDATFTPAEAAGHIVDLLANPSTYEKEGPIYVDLLGKPLPW